MMKVLTGVYQMDAGEILLDGKPYRSTTRATRRRWAFPSSTKN